MASGYDDDGDSDTRLDLDDGLRFLHGLMNELKREIFETSMSVFAVVDELIQEQGVDHEALNKRFQALKEQQLVSHDGSFRVRKHDDVDKYAITDLPDIDCDARMHLCHGRCCTFVFPLSEQDLDEGVVKWRYGQPYRIRHGAGDHLWSYCVHSHPETHGCTVYEHRPAICRTYSCKEDKRIWKDFEARIPADVWPPPPDDFTV